MSLLKRFYKIAGLEEDMANRIMYSLSLSKASPAEINQNLGYANTDMLDAAVQGADNLIKYGLISIYDELKHYKDDYKNKEEEYQKSLNETKESINTIKNTLYKKHIFSENDYKIAIYYLDIATKKFKDVGNWFTSFGGFAWERISKSLSKIAELKLNLLNEEDNNKKTNIKKLIVLEMNYFDSLAHNTGSIQEKLIEKESNDFFERSFNEDSFKILFSKIMSNNKVIKILGHDATRYSENEYKIKSLHDLNYLLELIKKNSKKEFDSEYMEIYNDLKTIERKLNIDLDKINSFVSDKKIKINRLLDSKDLTNPNALFSEISPYVNHPTLKGGASAGSKANS